MSVMHLNMSSLLYRIDKFTELLDLDLIISFKIIRVAAKPHTTKPH